MTLWSEYVKKYRSEHPELSYKEAVQQAKPGYNEWKKQREGQFLDDCKPETVAEPEPEPEPMAPVKRQQKKKAQQNKKRTTTQL